ncbi:hypothetical protein MLD38_012451 [Melastoma candidum]|uniref:Uncharacterized protein n=1 Tax=Melastoma candidum TaxID=119954 RepID=A0ACB9R6E1_9MYRT|nr:hypothetical protein MLD38_012451 [Melastoma candidum]
MGRKKRSDYTGGGESSESQESGAGAGRGFQRQPPQQGGGPQGGRAWVPQAPRGGHSGYAGGPGHGMPQQQQYGGPPEYQGREMGVPPEYQDRGRGGPSEYQGRGRGGPPARGRSGHGGGHEGGSSGGPPRYASVPELHQATQAPYYTGITPQPQSQEAGTSSLSPKSLEMAEQIQHLSIQQSATSQAIQPAPPSSKSMKFPLRLGLGSKGTRCIVKANHFFAELPDKDLHQYDVSITPEVSSRVGNRQVMKKLVDLYKESLLGNRLPAYDGRKSLYTAGPLPFQSKEFRITLIGDEEGAGTQRREREFKVVIKLAARADLHHLGLFLRGRQADAPQEALQVLDIVLRELPTSRYWPVASSFYAPDLGRR